MAADGVALELTLRLGFDTAALVLIWLVELVIYPVFRHLDRARFRGWHTVYTGRVTLVVMPVMLGQMALYAWLIISTPSWSVVVNLLLIVAVWASTFLFAVPLHGALDGDDDHLPLTDRLIAVNRWRTMGWTLVWLVTAVTVFARI